MKTFVIGDIHGAYKALIQCLERSGFDKENDLLIQLGDVVDGWSETYECVEELLTIKNLISIKGNHDEVFRIWLERGVHMFDWSQGGEAVIISYARHTDRKININTKRGGIVTDLSTVDIPQSHQDFFKRQHLYYVDDQKRGFVHGGYLDLQGLGHDDIDTYIWDRKMWEVALVAHGKQDLPKLLIAHKEVYIGHTATVNYGTDKPLNKCNVWNMDTGAGWFGKLSIMDVDTKEVWQSDLVQELYSDEKGRE